MKTERWTKRQLAEKFRFLAQCWEKACETPTMPVDALFTCNAVAEMFGEGKIQPRSVRPMESRYRAAFLSVTHEIHLWNQDDCQSLRVLMLCFAAAMAETGDL